MFFPTKKASAAAGALKEAVAGHEATQAILEPERYSASDLAISTAHSRQDLVLIYSMLTDNHRQLVTISRGVWVAVFFLFLILANQS